MLSELRVKNFAIVEDGQLEFSKGMIAFTGETGAGKSLLLDAITLLLGAKARRDLVRTGSETAEVEGVFDLSDAPEQRERLKNLGFEVDGEDGHLLLIRREFSADLINKNRIWIQGRSATRKQLQGALGDLVEISGQHEFLRLGREDFILNLVDQYGGLKSDLQEYEALYFQYHDVKSELEELERGAGEKQSRIDFLKFQIEELERAGIAPGLEVEEAQWLQIRGRLGNVEKLQFSLGKSKALLDGSEMDGLGGEGVVSSLTSIERECAGIEEFGTQFKDLSASAESLRVQAEELRLSVAHLLSNLEADPETLDNAEERLSQLKKLKRKYSLETEGLIQHVKDLRAELDRLDMSEEKISLKQKHFATMEKALFDKAYILHERRVLAAKEMQKRWQVDIRLLGMPQAQLNLELEIVAVPGHSGMSKLTALFTANKGEKLHVLGKVASGGELSRILLALKNIVASKSEVGVYLFDEVDAGIGGETALRVAERLKAISKDNQVLVVTHLASIASYANAQIFIEKETHKGRTRTLVRPLSEKERVPEIARMLGQSSSKAAMKLAQEMLESAQQSGKSKAKQAVEKSSVKSSVKSPASRSRRVEI